MSVGRRELIQLGAGAGAGLMLSPVPWKLLDDTSKWSQNWSWIPKLPHGEVTAKQTRCTLCPGGCAVEARCIGGSPVYLKGSGAPLCTYGLGGHHLAFHPERLREPNIPLDQAVSQIASAASRGPAAVIDFRPGRATSEMYRRFAAALPGARYVAVHPRDGATLRAMEESAAARLSIDLAAIETIVGVGTPVLDGWSGQQRIRGKRVVQIDSRYSATAAIADEWIRTRPGAEIQAALEVASRISGPALFVADGEPGGGPFDAAELRAIAELNLKTASAAIATRERMPWEFAAEPLSSIEDRSLRLLILGDATAGESISWRDIERKLAPDAVIASFSPYLDALTRRASIRIPAPAAYEAIEDVPPAPYEKELKYAQADPLHAKPIGGIAVADVLRKIAPTLEGSPEDIRKELMSATPKQAARQVAPKSKEAASLERRPHEEGAALAVVSFGWRGATGVGLSSPLVTKLYQESQVRPDARIARINPATAQANRIGRGDRIAVTTPEWSGEKTAVLDSAVQPGAIEIADSAIGHRWTPVTALRRLA